MIFKCLTSRDDGTCIALTIFFFCQVHSMDIIYRCRCQILCWILDLQMKIIKYHPNS